MADDDSHSTASGEKGHSTILMAHYQKFYQININIDVQSLLIHFWVLIVVYGLLIADRVIQQCQLCRKIAQKWLEISLFLYNLQIYFCIRLKEESNKKESFVFLRNLCQKKQLLTLFQQVLSNILRINGNIFRNSQATLRKPYQR